MLAQRVLSNRLALQSWRDSWLKGEKSGGAMSEREIRKKKRKD
jgi:hypothetical protein